MHNQSSNRTLVAVSDLPDSITAQAREHIHRHCVSMVQLRRGATAMTITWPLSAAGDFGAWMRELLR